MIDVGGVFAFGDDPLASGAHSIAITLTQLFPSRAIARSAREATAPQAACGAR